MGRQTTRHGCPDRSRSNVSTYRPVLRGEVERRRVGRGAEYRLTKTASSHHDPEDTSATDGLLLLAKQLVGSEAGRVEALAHQTALQDERDTLAKDLAGVIRQRDALGTRLAELEAALETAVTALRLSNANVRQMHDVVDGMVARLDAVAASPFAIAVRSQIRAISKAPATLGVAEG